MPYKKPEYCSVYMILNTINGHIYVGSTDTVERRLRAHVNKLTNGNHHSVRLQRAWDKYGEDAFIFSEIERMRGVDNLLSREQHYIDALCAFGKNGYNMLPLAGTTRGHKRKSPSAETLLKMSASQKGRKHSEETKQKISAANKGLKRTPEHNKRASERMKGKRQTQESIQKRVAKVIGRKMPPRTQEWRENQSALMTGRPSKKADRIIVDGVEYFSKAEAMRTLKCSFRKLREISSNWTASPHQKPRLPGIVNDAK